MKEKKFIKMFNTLEDNYNKIVLGKDGGMHGIKLKVSFGSTNPKLVAQAIRKEEECQQLNTQLDAKTHMKNYA